MNVEGSPNALSSPSTTAPVCTHEGRRHENEAILRTLLLIGNALDEETVARLVIQIFSGPCDFGDRRHIGHKGAARHSKQRRTEREVGAHCPGGGGRKELKTPGGRAPTNIIINPTR